MRTHSCAEAKYLKGRFPFYDFDDLAIIGGTTYVIKAPDEYDYIRYGDIELGNCSVADYHKLEGILLDFFSILLDVIEERECTIIRYEPKWVIRASESPELSLMLNQNGINDDVYGITVDKDDAMVKEFVTSSFRYNSFVQVLFPRRKVIITPTDHMDLFLDIPASNSVINQVDLVLRGVRKKDTETVPLS